MISTFIIVYLIKTHNPYTSSDTLVIGIAAGYAPFVSINRDGNYEGFDIDIAQALADKLEKKLILQDLGSMTSLFIALEQGSIDAIIWGLSITKERLQKVAMIRYQGETVTEYPLLFWNKIPDTIATMNDIDALTVSVEAASAQESALNNYPGIQKRYVDKIDDALFNIQYGKTDAALVEPAIARKFQKKYPELKSIPLKLAPQDQVQGIGIAIKKGNEILIKNVESAINTLHNEDIIKNLERKWGLT